MLLAHFTYPLCWNQLLAFPTAFVQNQLTKFSQGFRLDMYPPTTGIYTFRTFFPCPFCNIHRCENSFLKIFGQFLSCYFLNYRSQHIRNHRIIRILGTWCFHWFGQEGTNPLLATATHIPIRFYPRCHGKQIADGHRCQILRNAIRQLFWEESSHTVIQSQTVVFNRQTNSNPYKSLRARIHRMTIFRCIRFRIHFTYYLTMTHHYNCMHIC